MYEPKKAQLPVEMNLKGERADGTEEKTTILAICKMLVENALEFKDGTKTNSINFDYCSLICVM